MDGEKKAERNQDAPPYQIMYELSAGACAPSSQLSDSQSCSVCVEKQEPGALGSAAAAAAAAATCGAQETKGVFS
ncbi:UNVERIFIED_CONTAM: hypothetical protein FKN15_030600 [Acipenser sinensis]